MNCPNCQRLNVPEAAVCIKCKSPLVKPRTFSPQLPNHLRNSQLKEYRVVSQRDHWFTCNFNPSTIENALNELAREGWQLVTVTTQRLGGIGNSRDEIFFFLERDLP